MIKKFFVFAIFTGVALVLFIVAGVTASAHSFYYWERPHWVTVTRPVKIVKIKRVYPLAYSYEVKSTWVYRGHHLKVHHAVSFNWMVESGKFNSNSYYTYAVAANKGWFKAGIH